MQALMAQYQQAMAVLAMDALPKFVQSKACLPIVEKMTEGSTENMQRADNLLWSDYKVYRNLSIYSISMSIYLSLSLDLFI